MAERHYLGVYWADRKASVDESTEQTLALFRALGECDATFARWFPMGTATREESLARELTESADLVRGVYRARQQADASGAPPPDHESLGFYFVAWNGEPAGESTMLDLTLGAHPGLPNVPAPNSCLIRLPANWGSATGERVLKEPVLRKVLAAVARVFEPDWGIVSTDKVLVSGALGGARVVGAPQVGWLTYLRKERGEIPALPEGASVEVVEGLGSIVSAGEALFELHSETNDRAGEVEAALAAAGVLEPTVAA